MKTLHKVQYWGVIDVSGNQKRWIAHHEIGGTSYSGQRSTTNLEQAAREAEYTPNKRRSYLWKFE